MPKEGKTKNPRRMQAIAWRDGREKEVVVKCLNRPNVVKHQPSGIVGNAGKQVLWAAQTIRDLANLGVLDQKQDTASLFGDPEEVRQLKEQVANLEQQLKTAQGGEVSYINTINSQQHLLTLYRHIADRAGFVVDEEQYRFRSKDNTIWITPLKR